MPKLFYSIDGGREWVEAREGLRVLVEELEFTPEDTVIADVLVNFTQEGIIVDIVNRDDSEVEATESETYYELCDRLLAS